MNGTDINCRLPIRTPWDGRLATREEIHHCASCDERVCWECREMDVNGDDHCPPCANELEIRDPGAFAH